MSEDIYHFSATDIESKETPLFDYKGKILLIVNTASHCHFTPQYEGLEKLYRSYKGVGFEILAFPCNQFGHQEPGPEEKIRNFCEVNYGLTFKLFFKTEVNGENSHPLFNYLKTSCPGLFGTESIKWNFTKFLVDRNGIPIKRFSPFTTPDQISSEIESLLYDEKHLDKTA